MTQQNGSNVPASAQGAANRQGFASKCIGRSKLTSNLKLNSKSCGLTSGFRTGIGRVTTYLEGGHHPDLSYRQYDRK